MACSHPGVAQAVAPKAIDDVTALHYRRGFVETLSVRTAISTDGSRKYSFELDKGLRMEAAFFVIPGRERPNIACVSTQLGCAVGCLFCAAGHAPLFRNLTREEILFQVNSIVQDQRTAHILDEGVE